MTPRLNFLKHCTKTNQIDHFSCLCVIPDSVLGWAPREVWFSWQGVFFGGSSALNTDNTILESFPKWISSHTCAGNIFRLGSSSGTRTIASSLTTASVQRLKVSSRVLTVQENSGKKRKDSSTLFSRRNGWVLRRTPLLQDDYDTRNLEIAFAVGLESSVRVNWSLHHARLFASFRISRATAPSQQPQHRIFSLRSLKDFSFVFHARSSCDFSLLSYFFNCYFSDLDSRRRER